MADETDQTWALGNAEEANARQPDSFFIPPRGERESRQVGSFVQLLFVPLSREHDEPRAERMWVEVKEFVGGRYRGVLMNEPAHIKGLHRDDLVEFGPEHICRTTIGRGDPLWADCWEQRAAVSQAAFGPGARVRYMYREAPTRDDDSGWRLLEGGETQDALDDPASIRVCAVGWLVDWDRSLVEPLRSPVGSAFERKDAESPWVKVEHRGPPDE